MGAVEKPLTEIELGELLRSCTGGQSGLVRRLAFERDLLREQLAAAQERLRVMEWRPIAEYDAMDEKPKRCLFRFEESMSGRMLLSEAFNDGRTMGFRVCTHFLQLPPIPEGEQ